MKNWFKNKNINWIKIAVMILIILYIIFGTDYLKDIKKNTASVGSNKETENVSKDTSYIKGDLEVHFIDVGQADAIFITTNEHNMLVDAGNNEDGNKLVNYFNELGVTSFDYVVGTHPHEDHIGGMDDVIKNFDVNAYLMPDKLSTSKTFEDLLDALIEKNLKYTVPKKDEVLNLGDATIKVIHVGSDNSDANDSSIVLKLTYGNNSFLLTGDATSSVEKDILNDDIKADVLKVGHHGSEYSSTDLFLDKVNPNYAVIEVGKNNIYNHPKQVTIDKLNKRNIKIYRTDMDGTIIFTSDGNTLNVKTINTDTNG